MPAQVTMRYELLIPPHLVNTPLLNTLIHELSVGFNILRASIDENGGMLMMDLTAPDIVTISKGVDSLVRQGVTVKPVGDRVVYDEKRCIQCGYCPPYCPTNALVQDPATKLVSFDKAKCVICGVCLKVCPSRALSLVSVPE
jgi:ferredoxin